MRLSELLGRKVVTESGVSHGQGARPPRRASGGRLRVTGLVCGGHGFLERYGVGTGGSGGANAAKVHGHPAIPWERVVRVGAEIVIRD